LRHGVLLDFTKMDAVLFNTGSVLFCSIKFVQSTQKPHEHNKKKNKK